MLLTGECHYPYLDRTRVPVSVHTENKCNKRSRRQCMGVRTGPLVRPALNPVSRLAMIFLSRSRYRCFVTSGDDPVAEFLARVICTELHFLMCVLDSGCPWTFTPLGASLRLQLPFTWSTSFPPPPAYLLYPPWWLSSIRTSGWSSRLYLSPKKNILSCTWNWLNQRVSYRRQGRGDYLKHQTVIWFYPLHEEGEGDSFHPKNFRHEVCRQIPDIKLRNQHLGLAYLSPSRYPPPPSTRV